MVDIAVEKSVCEDCGAEIRDESRFCYNCGEAVAEKAADDIPSEPALKDLKEPIAKAENGTGQSETGRTAFEKARLQTAAGMRKRPKSFQRKRVEVVWEPRTAPNGLFTIAVIGLTLIAVFLLVAAMYLR
jgi:hypothetical protein